MRQKDLWRPCRSSSPPRQWKVAVVECLCLIFYEGTSQRRTSWLAEAHIFNSLVEEKCAAKFCSWALAVKKTLRCDRKTLWQSKEWRCMLIRGLMQSFRQSRMWYGAAAWKGQKKAQYTIWGHPLHCIQKKGSIITAERTTYRRMVTRNTKDFMSSPPLSKETTETTLVD